MGNKTAGELLAEALNENRPVDAGALKRAIEEQLHGQAVVTIRELPVESDL